MMVRNKVELPEGARRSSNKDLTNAVFAAIAEAPPGTEGAIDRLIERVAKLADEAAAALEEATDDPVLKELPSRQARALHVFLNDFGAFRHAEEIVYTDSKRGRVREWTMFSGRKDLLLSQEPAAIEAFKQELKALFDTANIHVDIFERDRVEAGEKAERGIRTASLVQLTIYREDRPDTQLAFDRNGVLGSEVRRNVLEAALTYERAIGAI